MEGARPSLKLPRTDLLGSKPKTVNHGKLRQAVRSWVVALNELFLVASQVNMTSFQLLIDSLRPGSTGSATSESDEVTVYAEFRHS